jgi:hypothetical protein
MSKVVRPRELGATHASVGVVLLTVCIEQEQVLEALKLGVAGIVLALHNPAPRSA